MKRITTSFICVALLAFGTQCRAFSLNPVEARPSSASVDMSQPGDESVLHVDREPLLSLGDFLNAKVASAGGRSVVSAELTDVGAARLKAFTAAHIGQRLAVLLGNRVIAAPVIRAAIGKKFRIDAFDEADAKMIAQAINQQSAR